jgi:hypothetical protein
MSSEDTEQPAEPERPYGFHYADLLKRPGVVSPEEAQDLVDAEAWAEDPYDAPGGRGANWSEI